MDGQVFLSPSCSVKGHLEKVLFNILNNFMGLCRKETTSLQQINESYYCSMGCWVVIPGCWNPHPLHKDKAETKPYRDTDLGK